MRVKVLYGLFLEPFTELDFKPFLDPSLDFLQRNTLLHTGALNREFLRTKTHQDTNVKPKKLGNIHATLWLLEIKIHHVM